MNAYDVIAEALPADTSQQTSCQQMLRRLAGELDKVGSILDFGCGNGRSIDLFSSVLPAASWVGVDIDDSPEVRNRSRTDGEFVTYNGRDLPFDDNSFDLIYSDQVLEHIPDPDKSVAEVFRVLKPGGICLFSTSQLEPYHSFSYYNFTAYGLFRIFKERGFIVKELRPGIDGHTLFERAFYGRQQDNSINEYFHKESPLNVELNERAEKAGWSIKQANFNKLMFAGHIVVLSQKPEN